MGNEWQEEYRGMMEREYFSKEEKETMVRKLMGSTSTETVNGSASGKKYRTGRFGVKGVVAACLIGCLFVTGVAGASAAGLLKPVSDVFAEVFGFTANDEELAEEMGKSLGESVVSNGIRVTADAVIVDPYAYAIVFSVEREDGKPLGDGKTLSPEQWDFDIADVEVKGPGWGNFYSYDETPEDSAIQYVMVAYGDRKIKAEDNISVHLSDLYHFDKGSKDYIVKGDWNMELSFPETESSDALVTKGEGKIVELDGNPFTIEDISVSPISYHFIFSLEKDSGLSIANGAKLLDSCVMELELKDGKRLGMGDGGSAVRADGKEFQYTYADTFDSLVRLEDVKAIHIGEVEIPVSMEDLN